MAPAVAPAQGAGAAPAQNWSLADARLVEERKSLVEHAKKYEEIVAYVRQTVDVALAKLPPHNKIVEKLKEHLASLRRRAEQPAPTPQPVASAPGPAQAEKAPAPAPSAVAQLGTCGKLSPVHTVALLLGAAAVTYLQQGGAVGGQLQDLLAEWKLLLEDVAYSKLRIREGSVATTTEVCSVGGEAESGFRRRTTAGTGLRLQLTFQVEDFGDQSPLLRLPRSIAAAFSEENLRVAQRFAAELAGKTGDAAHAVALKTVDLVALGEQILLGYVEQSVRRSVSALGRELKTLRDPATRRAALNRYAQALHVEPESLQLMCSTQMIGVEEEERVGKSAGYGLRWTLSWAWTDMPDLRGALSGAATLLTLSPGRDASTRTSYSPPVFSSYTPVSPLRAELSAKESPVLSVRADSATHVTVQAPAAKLPSRPGSPPGDVGANVMVAMERLAALAAKNTDGRSSPSLAGRVSPDAFSNRRELTPLARLDLMSKGMAPPRTASGSRTGSAGVSPGGSPRAASPTTVAAPSLAPDEWSPKVSPYSSLNNSPLAKSMHSPECPPSPLVSEFGSVAPSPPRPVPSPPTSFTATRAADEIMSARASPPPAVRVTAKPDLSQLPATYINPAAAELIAQAAKAPSTPPAEMPSLADLATPSNTSSSEGSTGEPDTPTAEDLDGPASNGSSGSFNRKATLVAIASEPSFSNMADGAAPPAAAAVDEDEEYVSWSNDEDATPVHSPMQTPDRAYKPAAESAATPWFTPMHEKYSDAENDDEESWLA